MLGDMRWGGLYGVDVDFIAMESCKICTFRESAIKATLYALMIILHWPNFVFWSPELSCPSSISGSCGYRVIVFIMANS
jgi:hypothetical protein